jgi:hypothetical protein
MTPHEEGCVYWKNALYKMRLSAIRAAIATVEREETEKSREEEVYSDDDDWFSCTSVESDSLEFQDASC